MSDRASPSAPSDLEQSKVKIRRERAEDHDGVREVLIEAFGQTIEAEIVEALREGCDDLVSLVATEAERVVGHILFSPVIIDTRGSRIVGMGLAPMAVRPELQRRGVGQRLVWEGIETLKQRRCPFVIVLGHPNYYPRFGFRPASLIGVHCQWRVPDEAFLILVLDDARMAGVEGVARYRSEFDLSEPT